MKKKRILIEVSGGVAEHTASDGYAKGQEPEVVILDWDNIEAGDEPPRKRLSKDDNSEIAEALREAWSKYDKLSKEDA